MYNFCSGTGISLLTEAVTTSKVISWIDWH